MPAALSYPGVYIEEIPSGVRTIAGVPTSIAAFIGRALRGPVNEPVTITSWADFERTFGGLWADTPATYAVRDFFLNGGGQAIFVRLFKAFPPGPDRRDDKGYASADVSTLKLLAASPGSWGNELRITIDHLGITEELAKRFGLEVTDLFNLTVTLGAEGPSERFVNLSAKEGPRRVDRVLEQQSQWLRHRGDPLAAPAATTGQLAGGNDGETLTNLNYAGSENEKTGIYALEKADLFNLLCIPPDRRGGDTDNQVYKDALPYCVKRRAILIVDPLGAWDTALPDTVKNALGDLGLSGSDATNAAIYYPRLVQADPLRENQPDAFAPCGAVAGVIARTDTQRGIWKAPAGLDASVGGIQKLAKKLTDKENGVLNPVAINCLRTFPVAGTVVWGARTMRGADQLGSEWKYLPVRRVALFIEESLYRGTQWVVFEPNDEPLWAQIRLNVGAFMNDLFRQGAFQGSSPKEAYFVKCDKETTTQSDINRGIVNLIVGFAPLKPAEFVVIKLQQMAGQIQA